MPQVRLGFTAQPDPIICEVGWHLPAEYRLLSAGQTAYQSPMQKPLSEDDFMFRDDDITGLR